MLRAEPGFSARTSALSQKAVSLGPKTYFLREGWLAEYMVSKYVNNNLNLMNTF